MRLDDSRASQNVEDRRGSGGVRRYVPHIGFGGLAVLVVGYLFGINPSTLLGLMEATQGTGTGGAASSAPAQTGTPTDPQGLFAAKVLGETEDMWTQFFKDLGSKTPYPPPTLTLFSGSVESACGMASAAAGPFYCPGDQHVYIDLDFFNELESRFGAPGDFARAYVIAHEVGHHIQFLLGTTEAAEKAMSSSTKAVANRTSVALELQADCYAGIWAKDADSAHKILEAGDLDEALKAASAVGDDTLQKATQGRVVPDSFTHGTSQQRMRWFKKGYDGGTLQGCDTFSAGADL
ncbi:MAG: neutral zinc metallopeptidase [Steroidobacteraceae bacterium]